MYRQKTIFLVLVMSKCCFCPEHKYDEMLFLSIGLILIVPTSERVPHLWSKDRCGWFQPSYGPAHPPDAQCPCRTYKKQQQTHGGDYEETPWMAPLPPFHIGSSSPPISWRRDIPLPLLVRKISPEVIFCFLAYFSSFLHSLLGIRMVRILPFSEISARPACTASTVR